jgi:hypothetical protein
MYNLSPKGLKLTNSYDCQIFLPPAVLLLRIATRMKTQYKIASKDCRIFLPPAVLLLRIATRIKHSME